MLNKTMLESSVVVEEDEPEAPATADPGMRTAICAVPAVATSAALKVACNSLELTKVVHSGAVSDAQAGTVQVVPVAVPLHVGKTVMTPAALVSWISAPWINVPPFTVSVKQVPVVGQGNPSGWLPA
jgi:hypothetical protein